MALNSNSIPQCPGKVCDDFNTFINTPESWWWGDGIKRGRTWLRYMYWSQLVEAAEAGCNTCAVFRDAVAGFNPDLGRLEFVKTTKPWSDCPMCILCKPTFDDKDEVQGTKTVSLSLSLTGVGTALDFFRPDGDAGEGCRSWPLEPVPPKQKEYTLDAKISTVATWLRDCRDNHPECCKSYPKLPKRVLDVSPPEGGLRLYESGDDEMAEYLCLSHRWGSIQPLTTTKGTLEERESSIPWEIVPRTFQDAIAVTRRLGIRYLWVDSLCIVQDDLDEWEQQAPEMCAIYSNAVLTISATRCNDSTDTLLPDFRRAVNGLDSEGNRTAIAVRSAGDHVDNFGKYSLLSRGWVLQERLLSRRVLHFVFDELMWECTEDAWCECDKAGSRFQPRLRNLYRKRTEPGKDAPQAAWYEVVKRYTELELTYPTDRGVAILGIARDMELTWKCRYVCGLWEDTLLGDLAWRAHDPNPSRLPGPTWSWISISGHCSWWLAGYCKWTDRSIVRVHWHPGTDVPSHLTLRGRCIKGASAGKFSDFEVPGIQRSQSRSAIGWEWFGASFGVGYMNETSDFSPDHKHQAPIPQGEAVFWVHIGSTRGLVPKEELGGDMEIGLVLRCVDATRQRYERVGRTTHGWHVAYSLGAAESRIRDAFLTFGEEMVFNLV